MDDQGTTKLKKLYRDFIKSRTKDAEKKYKVYKFITIMRQAKKEYYNNLLEKNTNDIKGTWTFLNTVIGKKSGPTSLPEAREHE